MKGLVQLLVGLAFIYAGVFLLRRRRVLFSKDDRETGGYQDSWFEFPNHVKMLGLGLAMIGIGCVAIYVAIVGWPGA